MYIIVFIRIFNDGQAIKGLGKNSQIGDLAMTFYQGVDAIVHYFCHPIKAAKDRLEIAVLLSSSLSSHKLKMIKAVSIGISEHSQNIEHFEQNCY